MAGNTTEKTANNIEVLARQQGANVRSFSEEAAAGAWLRGAREPADPAPGQDDLLAKNP